MIDFLERSLKNKEDWKRELNGGNLNFEKTQSSDKE